MESCEHEEVQARQIKSAAITTAHINTHMEAHITPRNVEFVQLMKENAAEDIRVILCIFLEIWEAFNDPRKREIIHFLFLFLWLIMPSFIVKIV